MIQKIRTLVEKNMNRVSELRCQIHRHPELSKNEAITASLAASALRQTGLEVTEGVGGHGVVALLRGGGKRSLRGPQGRYGCPPH